MSSFKRIFAGIDLAYLIRAWLLGGLLAAAVGASLISRSSFSEPIQFAAFLALCWLLFPFSKLAWDWLFRATGTNFVLPLGLGLILKLFVNAVLFAVAPFAGLAGVLIAWHRGNP